MEEKLKKKTEIVQRIRSFCISTKGALTIRQLRHDYYTIIGEEIPYQEFGFRKLEDFLLSEKCFRVSKRGNDFLINADPSEKSAHIAEMVANQKTKKKPPRVHFQNTHAPHHQHYQQTSKWRPKSNLSKNPNNYHRSSRAQAVIHTQFVNKPQPSVQSKVVVPEHSTINNPNHTRKFDLNQRLTNRLKENKAVMSKNNSNENGNRYSNQIPHNSDSACGAIPKPQYIFDQAHSGDTINPLLATKRRITKKMSELSIEGDSGNSSGQNSPTSDSFSPSLTRAMDFVRTDNPLNDLKVFAEIHGLGEVVINIAEMNARRNKFYSCKIKIGSKHTYSSYPIEISNPLEAQTYCCEEALKDLIPKSKRKSLMVSSEGDTLDRIPPMLEKHNRGVWGWQLKLDYSDRYNELLPDDWIKIVDRSPCVEIEKRSDDYILYHCLPGKVLQKGQQRIGGLSVVQVSVPANTIQIGDDGKLFAQVTCAMLVNEIWCQQIQTEDSNLYMNMIDRLQIYYQEHEEKLIPEKISHAGYYIAKYDNRYYRIRAVKVNEEDVLCFFIDWGDELTIPKNQLFELRREYAYAQAQAFVCRLVGLEELYDMPNCSQSLCLLYDKQIVIELADNTAPKKDEILPVYMYCMETGKSINEELIPKLTMELASPNLQKDMIMEVFISNIESNGDIYIVVKGLGYENFLKLKSQIEEQLTSNPSKDILGKVTQSNSKEVLYFFKHSDGCWHRIQLIDWAPKGGLAQIYFVDRGDTAVITVSKEDLYPIEKINDVFNNYPHQAVKIRMILEKIPPDFVELATKAMPKDNPVLMKIVDNTEDNINLVELFKRNADGGLFCINKSIALESELKKKSIEEVKSKFKIQFSHSGNVPSTGYLKSPPLPEIGQFFEVRIPFAVNPYNFFIQPVESKVHLNNMMDKLQERFRDVQHGNLKLEDILPGNIYASKHDDGFWYRTSVIKVIHYGSVSVFFCDFGYYQTVPVKQLVALDEEFMELPYQALKAKLTDVKPIQSKWTMEGCDQFKKMIEKKHFIALFVDIEKDILYESDLILKIMLIDTSLDQDIHIGKELVKNRIAIEDSE